MIDTSARVTPVDTREIDPTELRKLDDLIATFPPTSVAGGTVRDVLQALTWAGHGPITREVEVTVTRTQRTP